MAIKRITESDSARNDGRGAPRHTPEFSRATTSGNSTGRLIG